MAEFKQVILVRMDLKMSKGKLAAQVAHGSLQAAFKADKSILSKWRSSGMKKVVLKVKDRAELLKFKNIAEDLDIATGLISDAGMTELPPGSMTVCGIGPEDEEKIDKVTGKLTML